MFNQQHHFFATSLSHGKPPPKFMPSHHLAPPISWQPPPALIASQPLDPSHLMAYTPAPLQTTPPPPQRAR